MSTGGTSESVVAAGQSESATGFDEKTFGRGKLVTDRGESSSSYEKDTWRRGIRSQESRVTTRVT